MLFSFVSTFFKMTDAVNIATIEGFYKEPKNTIDVMMIGASEVYADYSKPRPGRIMDTHHTRLGYQECPAACTNQ